LALKNVAIVTTRWDMVGDDRAAALEQELVTGERYFAPLCRAGAVTFGHNNTPASSLRVMSKLLNNTPIVLQIQEELAKPGATLEQTAAGSQLSTDLDAMIKKHEKEMKRLREEIADAIKASQNEARQLRQRLAILEEQVERSRASKKHLKKPPYVPL
jgi:chromosome segregation ATPase